MVQREVPRLEWLEPAARAGPEGGGRGGAGKGRRQGEGGA